jgi:hypothetical protein
MRLKQFHRGAVAAVDDMMIYGRHDDPQSPPWIRIKA